MLTVHHHPLSTYSRRIRIALLEKQIEATFVEVDMPARAHKSPEFLALNPYGRVPVLQDGEFVVYESTAILEYLEAIHPTPPLVPESVKNRTLCSMHMKLCDLQFGRPAGTITFPKRFLPKERWDLPAMAQAKKDIEKHFEILERQLKGKDYMVGGHFSLVEVCYAPFLDFVPLMEITPGPLVLAWTARILDRASVNETQLPM